VIWVDLCTCLKIFSALKWYSEKIIQTNDDGGCAMAMMIHHLNGGTLHPPCSRFINGTGGFFSRGRIVCHCLLVETSNGLVLVDTGIGLKYMANPNLLGGRTTAFMMKPGINPGETAAGQVTNMGLSAKDVRHIILTHLDFDHAGGIRDFPDAQVHVLEQEYEAAMNPPTRQETSRYIRDQWEHGPNWSLHPQQGDKWYDFDNVQEILPEILLVPVNGHTRGHCGVAVKVDDGWFFHAGDTYTHRAQIDEKAEPCPAGANMHQKITAVDYRESLSCRERLRILLRNNSEKISVCCSHDDLEYDRFRASIIFNDIV
jgi:glyoxylase-like metal-dependent hydrolase (beta-lactamase superfamily II)